MNRRKSLMEIERGLKMMDRGLDIIEKNDVYWGDIDENFKLLDKTTRITDEVRETLILLDKSKVKDINKIFNK